jgi:hypothetical protein
MPRHMLLTISPKGSYSVSIWMNSTTGRLLIAAPVGLGAAVTQDLVVEVIVDEDLGSFGVLNFGVGVVVLDCIVDWLLDVNALTHVPASAEQSEPGGQPIAHQP